MNNVAEILHRDGAVLKFGTAVNELHSGLRSDATRINWRDDVTDTEKPGRRDSPAWRI